MVKALVLLMFFCTWAFAKSPAPLPNTAAMEPVEKFNKQFLDKNAGCSQQEPPCSELKKNLISDQRNRFMGLLENTQMKCLQDQKSKKFDNLDTFPSSTDLAKYYSKAQGASIGLAAQSQILLCLPYDDQQQKDIVAKYYYYYLRIEQSQLEKIEEAATADLAFGKFPLLQDWDCKSARFISVQKRCEEIKKTQESDCAQSPNFETMAAHTQEALQKVKKIEESKEKIGKDKKISAEDKERQIASYNDSIDSIQKQYPWMTGNEFKNYIEKKYPIKDAIQVQLMTNQPSFLKDYNKSIQVHNCLSGSKDSFCSAGSIRDFIDTTSDLTLPEIPQDSKKSTPEEKRKIAAREYLAFEQCAHKQTQDHIKRDDEIKKTMLLMAATGLVGVSGYAAGGAAMLAGRTLDAAKVSYWLNQTYNTAYFANSLKTYSDECMKDEQVLKAQKEDAVGSKNKCNIKSVYKGSLAKAKLEECTASKLVFLALDAVPVAAGVGSKMASARRAEKLAAEKLAAEKLAAEKLAAEAAKQTAQKAQRLEHLMSLHRKAKTADENMLLAEAAAKAISENRNPVLVREFVGKIEDSVDKDAARLWLAKKVMGREDLLTPHEEKWIMEVHKLNALQGYGKPGSEQIRYELKSLAGGRPSSITPAQTKKLMKNGILGGPTTVKDDPLVFRFNPVDDLPKTPDRIIDDTAARIDNFRKASKSPTGPELKKYVADQKALADAIDAKVQRQYTYETNELITAHKSTEIGAYGRDPDLAGRVVAAVQKRSSGNQSAAESIKKEMDWLKERAALHFDAAKNSNSIIDYKNGEDLMELRREIGYAASDKGIKINVDLADNELTAIKAEFSKGSFKEKMNMLKRILQPNDF